MVFFSQSTKEKEELMFTFFEKGYSYMYVEADSAYHHLGKALNIAREIDDNDSSLGILDHITITADYHHDLPKFREALRQMNALLSEKEITQKIQDAEDWQISYLTWLAIYHFETMEYVKAKELFIEARGHFDQILPEHLSIAQAQRLYNLYSSLGTTYRNLGEYELAELNYRRCIELVNTAEVLAANADHFITGVNQSMAQLYTKMGKHNQASALYLKNLNWSKDSYEKDKMFKNNLVNAYQQITLSYIAQDSLKKALYFLDQSQPYLLVDDPFHKDALLLYGDIYMGLKEGEQALEHYEKALAVFKEFRQNRPHQDLANIQGKIAELYLRQNNFIKGLTAIENAFNSAGSDIKIIDTHQNPDPGKVFSKTQLLQLLYIKLQLLWGSYEKTDEEVYQLSALRTCEDILRTFDRLKSEFESKLDKQFLAEKAYPIFYSMLNIAYLAYEKDPSPKTLLLALNIAEKNKDFVLLEALRNAQATQYGNVPQEVLDKEARLRTEITHIEKEIFDATETGSGFSKNLFKLKQQYYGFLDTIKLRYPKYHELKYQNTSIDLPAIRKKVLVDKTALISYTLTGEHLYTIVLYGSEEKFLKLPFLDTDRESIRKFYQSLSSPSVGRFQKDISDLGKNLYDKILKKPLEGIDSENLMIIPDGELHYLPFDLLEENGSYLLELKNIGYANSVTSLMELKSKEKSETNKILAFAPSFEDAVAVNTDRQFGKLLYNDDEVAKIGAFYETETILNEQATLASFKSKTPSFNVLHLATHASANDEYPDYSYLAFTETQDSTEGNILYIKDLYDITLNADMVTLSACQTGIGKLQKGQGMLSLSKGFYYAGAKSLVNTLWKINDKSTVKLMNFFYKGLSEGKSKTHALRDAKLKYLETTDDDLLRHPYYWAAFVVSGDVSPLTDTSYWWYIGAGVVFFMVLFLFSKRKGSRIKEFRRVVLRANS